MGAFDPERIIRELAKHGVRYVLVGATAARLQGFPRLTADADIAPANDSGNLRRLSAALRQLRARVFTESVPEGLQFSCDAETLSRSNPAPAISISIACTMARACAGGTAAFSRTSRDAGCTAIGS